MSERPTSDGLTVAIPLYDLLKEFRESIELARGEAGWDEGRLQQAMRRSFGFLAPYTVARIVEHEAGADSKVEFLILDFSGAGERDIVGIERAFAKATGRADRGDAKGALPELERIALEVPEVAKYHRALGQAYLVLERPDRAEDELLRSLALDPRDHDALALLGNLYARSGRPEKALPLYRRSIELSPNVYALTNAGAALAQTGALDEGIEALKRATDLDATYPNAWFGLGLALSRKEDLSLLPAAIGALDRAATSAASSPDAAVVKQEARRLLSALSQIDANETWQRQGSAVIERALAEKIEGNDLPVRLAEGDAAGVLAKIEFGWVHERPYHRILMSPKNMPFRTHHVLHELEHLRLSSAARQVGRNRWFATTQAEQAAARRSVRSDIARIVKRGENETRATQFAEYAAAGLLGQLYNFPVDLLIEDRLLARYPRFRELFFQSVASQLETAVKILRDRELVAMTPRSVFRANAAMNGAFAYWIDSRYPGRTDFASEFGRAETGPLSRALFTQWTKASDGWSPGVELDWVDQWAATLGVRDWYRWVDDPTVTASPPESGILEP